MLAAILFCCAVLMVGLLLRLHVGLLRTLYIPASVVAGVVGFVVLQALQNGAIPQWQVWGQNVAVALSSWPGFLIAIVFGGLLLERSTANSFGQALAKGARSAALAWIIILGQIVCGLLIYVTLVRPTTNNVPASFGQLLEVSWAGGFGSSAAMGGVYDSLGFPAGRDLAYFLATVGLIYGVVSGLVLVNIAIRRGWVRPADISGTRTASDARLDKSDSLRANSEVIEPLAVQILILAAAVGVGLLLQWGFGRLSARLLSPHLSQHAANVPLFLFTLIGGWCARRFMQLVGAAHWIDTRTIQRIIGVAMEFLIVAATATLRIESLSQFLLPIVMMILLAAAWSVVCLLIIAPRLLPRDYWFELGLLNYGFSTANTPQGMMLLRIVDPQLKSGAAEDYAVAAPLSAPFVGGGIVTIVVLPLVLQKANPLIVAAALVAIGIAIYAIARRMTRRVRSAK